MRPQLSLIIVQYRNVEALEHCLRSIHVATKAAVEIILVDNSPCDQAKKILRNSGFHGHYFPQRNNLGFSAAANLGARHADGDYLCFMHPDLVFEAHALDRLVTWVQQHPQTIAGPRERDEQGRIATTVHSFLTPRTLYHDPLVRNFPWPPSWHPFLPWLIPSYRYAWPCRSATQPFLAPVLLASCLLMSSTVWERVGEWSEEVAFFGLESEWFERARDIGVVGWFVPEAEVLHVHASQSRPEDQWRIRNTVDQDRRWHAARKGMMAVAVLGFVLAVERWFRPRPHG